MGEKERKFQFQLELTNSNIVEQTATESFNGPDAEVKRKELTRTIGKAGLSFVEVHPFKGVWFRPRHVIAIHLVEVNAESVYEERGFATV